MTAVLDRPVEAGSLADALRRSGAPVHLTLGVRRAADARLAARLRQARTGARP